MALVISTEIFRKVYEGGYATGAFNVNNMEIVQGITEVTAELKSPVIPQASTGTRKYTNSIYLVKLVEAVVELHPEIPTALYLDHGTDFATYKGYIDDDFASVMIGYSGHNSEENIVETRKVVEYVHVYGVVVEAEFSTLADAEDNVRVEESMSFYTRSEEAEEFVGRTGYGSPAIAISMGHSAYKLKPGTKPQLRLDILEEVRKRLPSSPIMLHGASSVPQECVKIINANDNQLKDVIGVSEDQFREVARSVARKINADPDLRLGVTAGIRQYFNERPDHFDLRQYLDDGRANVRATIAHKITEALGSNNRI